MSEHRRKQPQSQQPQYGGSRPAGPSPSGGRGQGAPRPGDGMPPRRTARPQSGGPVGHGMGPAGGPAGAPSGPRPTRAEMRRAAAQGKGGGGAGGGGRRGGGDGGSGGRGPAGRGGPTGPKPKRLIDYPRWGKSGFRRWVPSWKLVTSCLLFMFGGLTAVIGVAYANVSIPTANADSTKQGNIFYWGDGKTVMARTGFNRQNVTLDQVPMDVRHDFMAAEDETFETNSGVDPMSILRAVKNMATGGSVQSGSTITQQYVKNVYLNSAQTATRKFNEILISIKIGNGGMTKDAVLTGYLNTNYYGRGAYGIEAAAEAYYGVHASQLTLSEGAFIAATVNEPSTMQYVDSQPAALARATDRWKYVLNRMVVNKWMTQADHDALVAKPFPKPKTWVPHSDLKGQVGYLVDMATYYAEQHSDLTDAKLAQGGYSIYTTFDKTKVDQLSASVAKMESEHIDPKKRPKADKDVQVGAASVDPKSGAIVAIYGGAGMDKGHFTNNANTQGVPVGSTFKPIDLAAALKYGAVQQPGGPNVPITPDSKYNADDCLKIHDQSGNFLEDKSGTSACKEPDGLLHQANDTTDMFHYRTLRFAMEKSINTSYVQLGEDVGYSNVEAQAEKLGLDKKSLQYNTAGFFIGTSTPSAIRMANVYATFDNQGIEHDPFSVNRVTYDGTELAGWQTPKAVQALDANLANTVTDVLKGVVDRGTGKNAQALGRPVAGKTGTTDDYKSAWFIGYTPQLATSVVMFKEDPKNQGLQSMMGVGGFPKVFGANMPTEVWTDYMTGALNGQPSKDFPVPAPLGKGTNEPGAPNPTVSASASPSNSASASPSTTPSTKPTPTDTSTQGGTTQGQCNQLIFPCPTSTKHGGGNGGNGGTTTGTNGGTTAGTNGGTNGGTTAGTNGGTTTGTNGGTTTGTNAGTTTGVAGGPPGQVGG